MCYVAFLFAPIMLVCFWIWGDFSLRAKIVATCSYVATWGLAFFEPLATEIAQMTFALALYFMTFGRNVGRR